MNPMLRRDFLAAGLALLAARPSSAASAHIDTLPDEPIGTISPNIYGHFTEHLGGCIYDGIWVGEKSKVPNIGAIRKASSKTSSSSEHPSSAGLAAALPIATTGAMASGRAIAVPAARTSGPILHTSAKLPTDLRSTSPIEFGTNEFARFCQLSGAQPYLAANLRSLNAHDFYEWMEYCNSPAGTTSLADFRAQGGSREPLNVQYWGVGNESWGCGGNFTGDEYAVEFRRFTEWVPRFGTPLNFIASGPNVADYAWTRTFFEKLTEKGKGPLRNVYGAALHYYCGSTGKRQSAEFSDDEWYTALQRQPHGRVDSQSWAKSTAITTSNSLSTNGARGMRPILLSTPFVGLLPHTP